MISMIATGADLAVNKLLVGSLGLFALCFFGSFALLAINEWRGRP